jgi:alanine racemase
VSRLIRAVIDTQALRTNLATLRGKAAGARVMAVVKANAYGHGLVPTALALEAADAFAVARIEEAVALRDGGVTQPIMLLEGVCEAEDLAAAARLRLDLVVHEARQIALLERFSGAHSFIVWLKVDTGMNRLGFRVEEFGPALQRVTRLKPPPREIRILTHLARADETDCPMTGEQLERFRALTRGLSYDTSIGNSACILGWPDVRSDWVRPGIALYGISPFLSQRGADLGLVPVMTLETRVIAVRNVKRGETVGYGGTWQAAKDARIAIAAAGYGDGIRRTLPSGTPVLVNGHRASLAGRVSMDMLAIDVTDHARVDPGARVLLWGPELPVEEIAGHAGTIAYELVCGVSQRVAFEFR